MDVSREVLGKRAADYEKVKNSENLLGKDARSARQTLKLGRRVVEGLVRNNTFKRGLAANSYKKFMKMERVSNRIYSGIPDAIMFNIDWLSSFAFQKGGIKKGDGNSFLYFWYLIRFGYWNESGYLVMNDLLREDLQGKVGICESTHYNHLRWLTANGVFATVTKVGKNTYYEINRSVANFVNEDKVTKKIRDGKKFVADVTYEEIYHHLKKNAA